jgi:hypothetical protein
MECSRFAAISSYLAPTILAGMLAGCATPYSPPQFSPPDASIEGISSLLARPAGGNNTVADIVMIHGMCSHTATDGADDALWLAGQLGGTYAVADASELGGKAQLLKFVIETPRGRLNMHWILWSPLSEKIRTGLCYDVSAETPDCKGKGFPERAALNALLKNRIMDGCLSDAVYYAGQDGGRIIREAVKKGLRESFGQWARREEARAANSDASPLFFISSSLGSKILLDSVLELSCEAQSRDAVIAAAGRLNEIFMFANQIPILAPAYAAKGCAGKSAGEQVSRDGFDSPLALLGNLADLRRTGAALRGGQAPMSSGPLKIVAFSDPNDLLSYPLRESGAIPPDVEFVDVMVSNADAYLGLVERPDSAHLNYNKNSDVTRVVVFGRQP